MDSVTLLTLDEPVSAASGIVYSTEPKRAQGMNGQDYFVKGPEIEVVFAEVAGCLLAAAVGIPVAPTAICTFEGQRLAGSLKVADIGRNVGPWLCSGRATNLSVLYSTIVVDAWLANEDRNLGNVLGKAAGNGNVELVMIDYEKSATLRQYPLTRPPTVTSDRLWPRGDLGQIAAAHKPLHPPPVQMERVRRFADTPGAVQGVVAQVTDALGPVEWSADSVQTLLSRAEDLERIVEEVWNTA